jgi:hypothetical protein
MTSFTGKLKLDPWLTLMDESSEQIGLIEEKWNHLDTLTEKTKLLHNKHIPTQTVEDRLARRLRPVCAPRPRLAGGV